MLDVKFNRPLNAFCPNVFIDGFKPFLPETIPPGSLIKDLFSPLNLQIFFLWNYQAKILFVVSCQDSPFKAVFSIPLLDDERCKLFILSYIVIFMLITLIYNFLVLISYCKHVHCRLFPFQSLIRSVKDWLYHWFYQSLPLTSLRSSFRYFLYINFWALKYIEVGFFVYLLVSVFLEIPSTLSGIFWLIWFWRFSFYTGPLCKI